MNSDRQEGSATLVIILVVAVVLLLASAGFGLWAFASRQDYKNNSDAKAAQAVEAAKAAQKDELEKQFAEREKSPYKTYTSSPTFGSITFNYPKSWSVYIDDTGSQSPLKVYMSPNYVPALNQQSSLYALTVELSSNTYEQVLQNYQSQIDAGDVKATAFTPPPLSGQPNVQPGVRLEGQLEQGKNSAAVIMKVRDKTLIVTSQNKDYFNDFNKVVLDSLSFSP